MTAILPTNPQGIVTADTIREGIHEPGGRFEFDGPVVLAFLHQRAGGAR